MCGSLKLESQQRFQPQGSYIPSDSLDGPTNLETYKWDGFARTEGSRDGVKTMGDQWSTDKWTPVLIKATQFTERDEHAKEHMFSLQGANGVKYSIAALVNDEGVLKIMTRPANKTVGKVHSRMPVMVSEKMSRDEFVKFINDKLETNYS